MKQNRTIVIGIVACFIFLPVFLISVLDHHSYVVEAREENPSYEIHLTRSIKIEDKEISVIRSFEEPDKQKLGAWVVIKPSDKSLGSRIEVPILVIKCIIKHGKETKTYLEDFDRIFHE